MSSQHLVSDRPPGAIGTAPGPVEDRRAGAVRIAFGLLFLWASGVHVGIVSGDPAIYGPVADGSWVPGILSAWQDIFMAHPAFWGLMIALGEFAIGAALLTGGPLTPFGVAGAALFHVGLMTLGWGYWLWAVPALLILLILGRDRS
ncbi:hypothetical protein [Sporichthya polymorpha]|uniref:hypothetical protein n=1 Tax=Sporichthya polymorpha TaxID=35751 RepID=UPI00036351E9|nr:hypothetical protein [Sporichthya polymorpha]